MSLEPAADELRGRLSEFLASNPEAEYAREPGRSLIKQPWGDPALELPVREGDSHLIDALNAVRLPPRFNGIWHRDSRGLESKRSAPPSGTSAVGLPRCQRRATTAV
jgi:hypothetical protein